MSIKNEIIMDKTNQSIVNISITETVVELITFNDFVKFAKSRNRFTRHDIYQCDSRRRVQYWIKRALRYKIIKELEFHNYEYNQDILKSYEEFIGWLQNVDRFSLEEVPALDRYSLVLQAKRKGIIKAVDNWTWEKIHW